MRDGTQVPNQLNNEASKQRGTEAGTFRVRHTSTETTIVQRLRQTSKHEKTEDEKKIRRRGTNAWRRGEALIKL